MGGEITRFSTLKDVIHKGQRSIAYHGRIKKRATYKKRYFVLGLNQGNTGRYCGLTSHNLETRE